MDDKKNKPEVEDDDLMAMLEDSQQDFQKKHTEEHKGSGVNVIQQLEAANKKDSTSSQSQAPSSQNPNDFFKDFEQFTKNLGSMVPGDSKVSESEMQEATKMFQEMFKVHDDNAHPAAENNNQSSEAKEQDPSANPFLAGYQNMQKDAKNMNQNAVPGMDDINSMFQDSEFKDFFNNFTQGLFKQDGEGFDPSKMFGPGMEDPEKMMQGLMEDMSKYLQENQDNPEVKNTIEEMMSGLVNKESMYPPMKMMREEFPKYLEDHVEELDAKDLERYNNQLD